jgi:hypothetical protein
VNRIEEIKLQISELTQELAGIQSQCNHPPLARTYKYGSNTGNYDPHADCYWVDYECGLCQRRWTVDSQDAEYRPPEGAREVK